MLKSKFRVSFEYFIAWPSVLVFVNQNIVTVTSGVLKKMARSNEATIK